MKHVVAAALLGLTAGARPTTAQETAQAFLGARLIPIAGAPIEKGVLVVQRGKIVAVGAQGATAIPAGAARHDLRGRVVMPGLVDSHSHIGQVEGGDATAPIQAEVRALDSINVRDARIRKARAGGITTVNVMPGSGHLVSGQTVYLKLREGNTIDALLIHAADGRVAGGMKMANGTNSRRAAPFPGTRAKSAALVREQLVKAQEYRRKVQDAGGDRQKLPARDLAMEALVEVLEGKRIVHQHAHRHDDLLSAVRLAQEFGYRLVVHHVSEGWKIADVLAAAKVPCSINVVDSPGGKMENSERRLDTAAILDRAGALVGFHTDDSITDSRLFLRAAALAARAGLPREKALYGVTAAGARMLELEARVGSLEAGKDADFVVLSGDPLSVHTQVLETWVEGVKVFDRARPADRLYAVGGYGASHDQAAASHVDEEEEE
jgi:imidazolonepropionase-like amidohydrolase